MVKAAPSRLHWKVAPASLEKLKVALVELVSASGVESRVVLGAVRSTVHEWLAGDASVLPAASVARTWKEWLPAARPV